MTARAGHRGTPLVRGPGMRTRLRRRIGGLRPKARRDGMLRVAWPKRARDMPTDMNEDAVRESAPPRALVDAKVCAIDEPWPGPTLVGGRELRA